MKTPLFQVIQTNYRKKNKIVGYGLVLIKYNRKHHRSIYVGTFPTEIDCNKYKLSHISERLLFINIFKIISVVCGKDRSCSIDQLRDPRSKFLDPNYKYLLVSNRITVKPIPFRAKIK